MKLLSALLILAVTLCTFPLRAQETTNDTLSTSSKIDSIYVLQKKMYGESKNQPLRDKNYGIEFNFFRLLMIDEAVSFSGGFSLFGKNRHAEIAFPFLYSNPEDADDLEEFTLDCHYRYFLGNTQNGFYLSAFTRYAYLNGYLGGNDLFFDNINSKFRHTEHKIGIGIGLGYRIFSYRGLYWGTSLSFGRYIIGENDKFFGDWLTIDDDEKYIIDFEFLKFGFAF